MKSPEMPFLSHQPASLPDGGVHIMKRDLRPNVQFSNVANK